MKSGIVKKFKTFISLLLVFLMVVGIMPLNTIANAITWDLRSATVEYGSKNIYLFGVDSAQIKGDEDAQFIIQYSGADNMAEELYIDGAKETSASSNVTVNTNDNTVTIQKQWFETQSGWIGLKLSGKAYVPDSEPNLPEITGVTVEGVSTSYQGNEVDAVNITGADGCIVEYSVNGGSFTTEMPKLTAPTASALEITVKVTKNGYRELLKNVTANMTLGRVPVEVEPVSVLYSGSEIKLLSEPVYDSGLATLSYRVAGESDFKSDIPVRKYPGTYDVEIKVTPSNTTLYEEYTFTKTAVINSLVFDIDQIKIVPNTLTYNGTEQQAIAEPQYDPDMFENIQIKYKLDSEPDSSYSTDIPTVKNAGTYTFNVLITADGYEDYETSVSVNVEKAIPDISYSLNTNAVYSEGADIYLVTNAVVNKGEGKIEYSLNGSGYTTTVPTVKNAGAYRVSIRMPETDNYKGKTFESSRSITVAKATFVMDLPETPKEIVYNIDNTFGYQVKDSSKLPEGVIEYSIDEDGTTADAQIDEATGKVTYNGTGKITVKAVFISSASNNYKVEQGKDTVTYSLEIKYTSIPKEWNITESPFTSYDGFDFYGDTVTINSPDGWKVKRESVDFTGSEDETITATDWETSIAVDKFGSYENYTVRFKNDDTGEISESVTLDNFAIDNESTFSDVSYFNMYEINEDALPEIINILTFGVFCGEEARIAATAPNKQVGNAFEPAKEVIFTFGDNTNIPVQVKNGIAVTKFPENFSGTVKAQVVGFSGAESNITKMTETNSNVRFDSADNNKIITIDINPPVITDITFYEEIENSNGEINDVVVSVDEHNTFKVRNEFKVKVNASDELSGIAYIECTIDCNGKKETKKVSYTELKKFVADTIKGLTPFDDSAKTKISIKAVNNALLESETFVYYVNGDMTAPEIMSVKPTGDESVELLSEENKLKNDFAYFSQEAVELSVDIDDTNDGQIFSSGDVKLSYRFEAYPGESGTTDFSPYSNDYSVEVPENFKGWVIFKVKDGSRNESEEIWTKGIITASSAEHSKDNEGAFEKPNTGIFGTDQGSVFSSEDMLNSIYPDGNSHANEVAQEKTDKRDIYDIFKIESDTMFTVTLNNNYSGIKDVKFYKFDGEFTSFSSNTEISQENIVLLGDGKITKNGIDVQRKYELKKDALNVNNIDQTLVIVVTDNADYKYCMYYTFGTDGADPSIPTIKVDGEPSNGNTLNKKTLPNLEIVPAESDSNGSNESVRWKINDSDYVWLNDKVPEITEDGYYVVTAQTVDESGRVSDEVSTIIYVDQVMPVIESIAPVEKEETNLLVQGNYDENNKNNFEYFAETSGGFKVVIDDTDDGKIYSSENIKLTYKLIGTDNKDVVEKTVDTQKDGNENYYVIEVPKSFKGWIVVLASDRTSNISNKEKPMSSKGIIVADYSAHANDIVGTLEKPKTDIYNTTKPSDFDSDGMLGSVYPDGRVNSYKVAQENGNNRDIYDILEMKTETMFTVTLKNEYSGIKNVNFYTFSGNFTELNEDTEIDGANIQLIDSTTANGIDTYKKYTVNTTAFDENYHDQTLIVTVTDNVGYKYCMYYTFGSDGVTPGEPTINVNGTHNGDNEWFTNSPDGQGPQVTINPHEKDDRGTNEFVLWKWDSDTDYTDLADSAPSIVKNGVYQLSTYAYDEAKHESSIVTQEIKYDSVAPEFKVTINNNEIDMADHTGYYFYKDPIEIKIDSWDVPDNNDNDFKGSGVASVLYKIVYKGQEYTNVEWTSYDVNNKPKVYPNNSFTLYVKTIDVAGNATEKSTKTIVVDDKPPVGEDYSKPEISYYIPSTSTGFYTNAVTVDLKVIDHKYIGQTPSANGSCSGIERLDYTLKVDGVILEDRTNLIDNSQNGEIIDTKTSLINLDLPRCNSNDIEITLYASDKAGNETVYTIESGIIKIDATAPEIYVSYDNNSPVNDHFYNSTRTATVVITERNLDYNDVDITVTNTDGTAPVYSQWVKTMGTGNKDNTTHTMTITYNADGDYTFAIKVADMAGNTDSGTAFANGTANPDSFTVDMTKPVVSVSYDNNSAQNGKYFNAVRNATITVEEHNFDLQFVTTTITAAIEGQGISAPTVSWSHSGDTHTAYIGYTSDGDYTFDFDMADLAANKIDGVNYGASVAAQDFTVDTTIVEPTIEGVENGMPYKDEVIPSISFSDTNYSDYTVSLTRTRMNEIDVDVTELFTSGLISETGNGGSGVFDTFEKIRENDGIYRLTVTLNDLAGNTATSEVMFSVNRFGSVYVFGDYLISLQDAYVQKVSDDLVITEYNPDKLVEDSVKVQVTHDSSPMGNVNYTVNPVVNDAVSVGESGWYQYKYVIDSDNFEKDGVYSVIISSADEAGNMPETINFDDLEVLFRVDTVKPELTDIKGLEEAIVNSTGVDVTFSMFDAIGLKQVDIYVSGEKVNTLDASENMINFVGQFTIGEGADQSVRIVAEDMAGNILDTDSEEFNTDLTFVKSITVSTNFFVRWYANKVLFWSTTIAAVLILGGIAFFIYKKRREDEE